MKERITMVVGAGAPLGFDLPKGIIKPTTSNITDEVRKPYHHYENREIDIVEKIYKRLKKKYPLTPQDINNWKKETKRKKRQSPNINFEMLFHVMESYLTNGKIWSGKCHNSDISPVFSSFIKPSVKYDTNDLNYIMMLFIERIMDIVDGYDGYFRNNIKTESWYRDFFRHGKTKLDVFNFNYDTTIETSLGTYEDGFEPMSGQKDVQQFNPQKLWENKGRLSTINHIHGCINYFYPGMWHEDKKVFTIHDLFKYKDYATVKDMLEGRGQSNPTAQDHSEYYGGPIITGLRKTDKLNCIPYDFYHGHLYNCLMKNKALVIIGYSFGDFYMNNLIDRMTLLHGENKKVVVIDFWDKKEVDRVGFEHYLSYSIPSAMIGFLMRMSDTATTAGLAADLKQKDVNSPYYSSNGNLMVLSNGFKSASNFTDEIYDFIS